MQAFELDVASAASPGATRFRLLIKVMQPGRFADRLWHSVRASPQLTVFSFGALGKPVVNMADHDSVLLFGGGIGVTPMLSSWTWLHTAPAAKRGRVRKVRMILVYRDTELLELVAPALLAGLHASPATSSVELYCTNRDASAHAAVEAGGPVAQLIAACGAAPARKRPVVSEAVARTAAWTREGAEAGERSMAVLVCGPAALIADVVDQSEGAAKSAGVGVAVHSETFEM